jgi:RimJ/RimL family protein N-acetyltransferase
MTGDVLLRDVRETDLGAFFAQEHDPEAVRRSHFPPRERDRFMTHWRTRVLGDPTVFAQTVTVDGEIAGSIVAWWQDGKRYLGYWLDQRFWGRGIGTTAVRLFLDREKSRPLYADPYVGNTGSVRLLEKCGFRRAGSVFNGADEHVVLVLEIG